MATRIVLTVLDDQNRPYMGVFDSDQDFPPRLYDNGALKEIEHTFLIELARHTTRTWLPADSHWPLGCRPCWIIDAVWVSLEAVEAGGFYHKFGFNPPLEISPLLGMKPKGIGDEMNGVAISPADLMSKLRA